MSAIALVPFLASAFERVFDPEQDGALFQLGTDGISEQTLTFRLGLYLQCCFPKHHVDCEYNRLDTGLKTDPEVNQKWMKPDVIVHWRRIKKENLIVIEAKKARTWKKGWDRIEAKLKAFTRQPGKYEYRLGMAWRIAVSGDPSKHDAIWFWKGKEIERTNLIKFENKLIAALKDNGC